MRKYVHLCHESLIKTKSFEKGSILKIEFKSDEDAHQKIEDLLKNKSYVIITCSSPSSEGQMEVNMSHSGDEVLLSYLLEMGNNIFAEKFAAKEDFC